MSNQLRLILLFTVLFGSCDTKEKVLWVETTPKNTVSDFSDTVFFKWISDIEVNDNTMLFLDRGSSKAISTDEEYKYIQSFGSSGPGPMELQGVTNLALNGDKVMIYDYSGGKINSYSQDGSFIDSYRCSAFNGEFFSMDENVYLFSSEDYRNPIEVLDYSNGEVGEKFGLESLKEWDFPAQHLIRVDEFIVAVYAHNRPFIDVYNKEGKHLNSTDLSKDPILSPWLKSLNIEQMIEANRPGFRKAKTMFFDVHAADGFLYAMPPTIDLGELGVTSFLMEFSINSDGIITTERYIKLNIPTGSSFNCFAVTENRETIVGFDPAVGAIIELSID